MRIIAGVSYCSQGKKIKKEQQKKPHQHKLSGVFAFLGKLKRG